MFLLVGLGNPGIKYAHTRHNVGFWVIDELSHRSNARLKEVKYEACFSRTLLAGEEVVLVKPLTYMNRSGIAVNSLLKFFSLGNEDLLVIYDDMDLPLGRIRLRPKGGSGGHKGMASIIALLESDDFNRLRIGVGRGTGEVEDEADFLLSTFSSEEEREMQSAVSSAADAVEVCLNKGLETAMNRYNNYGSRNIGESGGGSALPD
ncbi:MAG: aminoacyl-tRNA hydrolase [Bacillota bacterium]|nr:aminoacyl-tRNA hydrolase [Bacillota bacterium]